MLGLEIGHRHEIWQLQTAKAQFSEVFRRARAEGPQYITRRGTEAVVMVAAEQWEALSKKGQVKSLVQFLRESPLAEESLGYAFEVERDADTGRDVEL